MKQNKNRANEPDGSVDTRVKKPKTKNKKAKKKNHENWVPILGSQHQCQRSYAVNSVRNSCRRIIWIQQTVSSRFSEKACPNRMKCGGTEWTPAVLL